VWLSTWLQGAALEPVEVALADAVRDFRREEKKDRKRRRKLQGMKPSICRLVLYRSRTGKYTVPAIITATVDTLNPEGVEAGGVPPLSSPNHVHLTVLTPGMFCPNGSAAFAAGDDGRPVSEAAGGSYQEWDVPAAVLVGDDQEPGELRASIDGDHPSDVCAHAPGTWAWPARVS
jgi:hypothetical protein